MEIIKNELDGQYAIPKDHPVTTANPAPWAIKQVKIETTGLNAVIYIRGDHSMWFRMENCYIGEREDMVMMQEAETTKKAMEPFVGVVTPNYGGPYPQIECDRIFW